jgi:BON domain-containing protein
MTGAGRLVVLAICAVLGAGCQTMTGLTARQWVDDRAITARVKARLVAVHPHTLTRINVDTYGGTVYLTGVVDSDEAKRQAEAIARTVHQVQLVVGNLEVNPRLGKARRAADVASRRDADAPAASPVTEPRAVETSSLPPSSLLTMVHGLARIDGDSVEHPHGPFVAYDRGGRLVATVYTVSMRELASTGLDDARAGGRPIDHVSIYPVSADPDVPDPHYHLVLWHVSRAEAAALR